MADKAKEREERVEMLVQKKEEKLLKAQMEGKSKRYNNQVPGQLVGIGNKDKLQPSKSVLEKDIEVFQEEDNEESDASNK